jgi:CHAT domain/Peptidase family C25
VVDVLQRAQDLWQREYTINATVRVGSCGNPDTDLLNKLRNKNQYSIVQSVDCCDPVDLTTLLMNDQYDLIHYAGHGVCDLATGQNGWLFGPDYVLSAKDIFRVRQVPRLVFANACFSSLTKDHSEQRRYMATMAQAFFLRGIPNYIGAGWQVDDDCAEECARWFYACLMGLRGPDEGISASQSETTIGRALRTARDMTLKRKPGSSSWGAYQHYGRVGDRLTAAASKKAIAAAAAAPAPTSTGTTLVDITAAAVVQVSQSPPVSPEAVEKGQAMGESTTATLEPDDPKRIVVNGINFRTGNYAFAPRSIDEIAKQVRLRPGDRKFDATHGADRARSFALPAGISEKIEKAGWAIVFAAGTPASVRDALKPLTEHRRKQAGKLLKELEYNGEQLRDWLAKQGVSPGGMKPAKLPYYLLLVGSPEQIPFEFQYLLGVEYAVGRLWFEDAGDYARYASSIIAYESGTSVPNAKQISYWGTRHSGDRATKLSASFLVEPLANGIPSDDGPVNADVGYSQTIFLGKEATKANLVKTLHAAKSPALLFTASHGMVFDLGDEQQGASQGALLCQDWPGFGEMKVEHFLSAKDVTDDANVNGMVAFLFACYGAGTPDKDQFVSDLSEARTAPPPAAKPFIAALPQRLLAHPKGGALAVIGHIDRAWSYSMQAPNISDPQIGTFRNSLVSILSGTPVGHAMSERFGARYGELSTLLLNLISPTATGRPPSDDELVNAWIERNDSQNYVLLGDPAVRIRHELLA